MIFNDITVYVALTVYRKTLINENDVFFENEMRIQDLNYSDLLEVKLEICYYIIECLTQIRNCTWAILKIHAWSFFFFFLLFFFFFFV